MSKLDILITVAIVALVIVASFFGIKIFYFIKEKRKNNSIKKFSPILIADSKNNQSHFFKESGELAIKIVIGKEPIDAESFNPKEKGIMDTLKFMNDEARNNVYITIQSILISVKGEEEELRQKSNNEGIPLWLAIIRESITKCIPNIQFPTEQSSIVNFSIRKTA